jgi:hypothetical protein
MELVFKVGGHKQFGRAERQICEAPGELADRAVVQKGRVLEVRPAFHLCVQKEGKGECGKDEGTSGGPFHTPHTREIVFLRQLAKRSQQSFVEDFNAGLGPGLRLFGPFFDALQHKKSAI